eukprot:1160066-Pelagomonas_calceolata.AAC.15
MWWGIRAQQRWEGSAAGAVPQVVRSLVKSGEGSGTFAAGAVLRGCAAAAAEPKCRLIAVLSGVVSGEWAQCCLYGLPCMQCGVN